MQPLPRLLVFVAILLPLLSHWQLAHAQEQVEWTDGMELGMGYDLFSGELHAEKCLVDADAPGSRQPVLDPAATSEWEYEETADRNTLRRILGISLSGSYQALTTGATGKASYLTTNYVDSSTATFSVLHRVVVGREHFSSSGYTPSADAVKADPASFRTRCGTHYIKTKVLGGEMYALLTHQVRSEAERTQFNTLATLSATSFTAALNTTSDLEKSSMGSRTRVVAKKAGADNDIFITPVELRTEFANFRHEVAGNKHVGVAAVLVSYPDPLPGFNPKHLGLARAVELLSLYKDAERSLDAIQNDPSRYFVDPATLWEDGFLIRQALNEVVHALLVRMNACSNAPEEEAVNACRFQDFPMPPPRNSIARLYLDPCEKTFTPARLTSGFQALPHSGQGDLSMGGQDVVVFKTAYSGDAGGSLQQSITVRIVETRGDGTEFKNSAQRIVWSETSHLGCYLSRPVAVDEPEVGAGFPLSGGITPENSYIDVSYDAVSKLVSKARCQSNKLGLDAGYAGCDSVEFKPIALPLDHIEHKGGAARPRLTVPVWLTYARQE